MPSWPSESALICSAHASRPVGVRAMDRNRQAARLAIGSNHRAFDPLRLSEVYEHRISAKPISRLVLPKAREGDHTVGQKIAGLRRRS